MEVVVARRLGIPSRMEIPGQPWEAQHFYYRHALLRGEYLLDRDLRRLVEGDDAEVTVLVPDPSHLAAEIAAGTPATGDDPERAIWEAKDPEVPPRGVAASIWHRYCRGRLDLAGVVAAVTGTMEHGSASPAPDAGLNAEHAERMGFTVRKG